MSKDQNNRLFKPFAPSTFGLDQFDGNQFSEDENIFRTHEYGNSNHFDNGDSLNTKTPSTSSCWNLAPEDYDQPVFSTVYASDLNAVIHGLKSGRLPPTLAAKQLEELTSKLDEPPVTRQPVPGTLPSERSMYLGVSALCLLGSPPCGLARSDSYAMNLACPATSSDYILISRRRLISVLCTLGSLSEDDDHYDDYYGDIEDDAGSSGQQQQSEHVQLINFLWREASNGYQATVRKDDGFAVKDSGGDMDISHHSASAPSSSKKSDRKAKRRRPGPAVATTSTTRGGKSNGELEMPDEIELGILKLALYGMTARQPSFASKYICLPCCPSTTKDGIPVGDESCRDANGTVAMKRNNGEMVRHDVKSCPMCQRVVGCPFVVTPTKDGPVPLTGISSSAQHYGNDTTATTTTTAADAAEVTDIVDFSELEERYSIGQELNISISSGLGEAVSSDIIGAVASTGAAGDEDVEMEMVMVPNTDRRMLQAA